MTTTTAAKRLITGGDPEALFSVPPVAEFDQEGTDFLPAPDIQRIAYALIAERPEFGFLTDASLEFVWKRKGGANGGHAVLGKCQKPSGLLKHYSAADFVFTFSADHCRDMGLTAWQMEALIDHELRHAHEEDGTYSTVGHDYEGFTAELRHYGFWGEGLKAIKRGMRQMPLFGEDD
jgi:hypothetical protein